MNFRNLITNHLRSRNAALVLLLALTAAIPNQTANAAAADEGLPGDWLSHYASPVAIGMGGATLAVCEDPHSALWNPAGLSWLRNNTIQISNATLFDDTSVIGLGFIAPSNKMPTFGVNLLYLQSGEFEQTNELNQTQGTFSEGDLVMALTASHQLVDRWSVGANIKLVRQTLGDFSGGGVGLDLGVVGELAPGVKLGASALNLGGPTITLRDEDESYARELRGGLSVALLEDNCLVTAEVAQRDGPGTQFRLGGQARIGALALRLGYYIENITAGFGYHLENGFRIDYGMNDHELGMVHRFGFTYTFGGFFAKSQASPEVFSPMGRNPITKFLLTAHTKSVVRDWKLTINDRSGTVVRSYAGQGQSPAQVIWDGKNTAGLPLPDGTYTYALQVVEEDGRVTNGRTRTVEIATSGPQGSIGVN